MPESTKQPNVIELFKEIRERINSKTWPQVGDTELLPKIPFFGQPIHYVLETTTGLEDYYSILRHFGWSVVFGITEDDNILTLVQWKPGVNEASWELPPGGIGKINQNASLEEILDKTKEFYLKETGYTSDEFNWTYLGHTMIETGKFRGADEYGNGLPAHMFMATGLKKIQDARQPAPNEIMETLEIPLEDFQDVIESGLFKETSALSCALLALIQLGKLRWTI